MPDRPKTEEARKGRADADGPTIIRKYPNRRLYNMTKGEFVKLDDLRRMVVAGEPFVVQDAKEGRDITSSILAQIIAEQEGRGESVLPGEIMRRLIAFYDRGMTEDFFQQMQESMDAFAKNWQPFKAYEEIGRRNAEMMRNSYESFMETLSKGANKDMPQTGKSSERKSPETEDQGTEDETVAQLQKQLDALQREMDALRSRRRK